jgi:hypothetical protein
MKTITYQQLRKLPPDTFFSTLSANNELGELWLTGEYPWGSRFIYSALSDVSGAGRKEVDFEDNTFDRKGHFVVWAKDELDRYMDKVEGILNFSGAPVASEGVVAPATKVARSIGVYIALDKREADEQRRQAEANGVPFEAFAFKLDGEEFSLSYDELLAALSSFKEGRTGGAALINPLTGTGVATSANAANQAALAKQLGHPIGYMSDEALQRLARGVGALVTTTNVDGTPVYLG